MRKIVDLIEKELASSLNVKFEDQKSKWLDTPEQVGFQTSYRDWT